MAYYLQFLLIVALVVLASAKVLVQGRCSRTYLTSTRDCIAYNGVLFISTATVLVLLFPIGAMDMTTVLFGIAAGITTFLYQVFYTLALRSGPVSLTVLLCNFNAFLIVGFCILVYRDTIYLTHLIGIAFMILTLWLSRGENKGDAEKKTSLKWCIYLVLALFSTGFCSIIQKYFSVSVHPGDGGATVAFLLVEYLAATLVSIPVLLLLKKGESDESLRSKWKPLLIYGFLTGVTLALFQRLNMYTMSVTDGTFMLPTFTGLQSVSMTLVGVVVFRDKLSKRQMLGVLMGVLCVICMNLRLVALT